VKKKGGKAKAVQVSERSIAAKAKKPYPDSRVKETLVSSKQ
jgi:hypothetical protein